MQHLAKTILNGSLVWLGIDDIEGEGNYTYNSDNSPIVWSNWGKNQPDHYMSNEHCVAMNLDSKFNVPGSWSDNR